MRVLGMTVYSLKRMETERIAYRRCAVFPTWRTGRVFRPGPAPASYSSARRSRSRDSTISGTRPLTSPPYLVISLTRLELRNE